MSEISYLHPPVVWLLTDQKPGHRSQLQGLGERLHALTEAELVWIDAGKFPVPLWRALLGIGPQMNLPRPDIIIAAGTGTHRLLLSLRRSKALTVVLMRPAFPYNWIDAAIVPAHDNPPELDNILITRGVLNAVKPNRAPVDEPRGLILAGGPSRHFVWDDDIVYQQVVTLSEQFRDWQWSLSSSRRTPDSFIRRVQKSNLPNLSFYHHDETDPDWVVDALEQARVVWVSPDSISMIYEALTSGRPTGLLDLEPANNSRMVQSLSDLERNGQLAPWTDRMALLKTEASTVPPLWEADRVARWVLFRWHRRPE